MEKLSHQFQTCNTFFLFSDGAICEPEPVRGPNGRESIHGAGEQRKYISELYCHIYFFKESNSTFSIVSDVALQFYILFLNLIFLVNFIN